MNRDDAIKKIKKCLALAASPNAHEAAAAMRQAQKLMNEHGLNETDLSLADVSEHKSAAHIAKQPKACKPITKTARGDEFAYGWVHGVQALVERFASSDRNQALIEQYVTQKYPNMKTAQTKDRAKGRNVSHNDTMQGIQAGRNAKLDRGVTGGGQTQGLLT